MGIRKYNPTTPGRRTATVSDFADLTPGAKPEKKLLKPKRRTGGRNNQGKITARHRGGGHKRRYRSIDFRRNKDGVPGVVASIQYDPNRSARIALIRVSRDCVFATATGVSATSSPEVSSAAWSRTNGSTSTAESRASRRQASQWGAARAGPTRLPIIHPPITTNSATTAQA